LEDLEIQLATVQEVGRKIVQVTYDLEGDSCLASNALDMVSSISTHFTLFLAGNHPSVSSLCKKLSTDEKELLDVAKEARLLNCAHSIVSPAASYFQKQLDNQYKVSLEVFRAARMCNPLRIADVHGDFQLLSKAKFISSSELGPLRDELSTYISLASTESSKDTLDWWKRHSTQLPRWSALCRRFLLAQPSSAAVERVFSLFSNCISDAQESMLGDQIELTMMLRYNK
jgi:hypothetical protein